MANEAIERMSTLGNISYPHQVYDHTVNRTDRLWAGPIHDVSDGCLTCNRILRKEDVIVNCPKLEPDGNLDVGSGKVLLR
jgi:hypothetical protein